MCLWSEQDAKSRAELLRASVEQVQRVVTRPGAETAVCFSIGELQRLQGAAQPSIKDLLLAPEPRFENLIPPRRRLRRRGPVGL
jgi:hypothetical protein